MNGTDQTVITENKEEESDALLMSSGHFTIALTPQDKIGGDEKSGVLVLYLSQF